ncbi:MAG TPA: biotin/lipoyl-containing protein, partial [Roseiarcus sp.]|nr:biotin/lipoyl-containing protein [Roseiarcus sp.]
EWHVKVGDRVRSGDIVAVVETQKGAIDVEIFLDGVVSKLLVGEGQRVPVGTVLAEVNGTGAAQPAPTPPIAVAETVAGAPPSPPALQPSQQAAEPVLSRPLATPSGPPAPAGARRRERACASRQPRAGERPRSMSNYQI